MKLKLPYKNTLNTITFLLLFLLFFSTKTFSQSQLLDSLTLDTLTAFTSIDEAMKHPDRVLKLELKRKKLTEFPSEIFKFRNLQYLDLSKNNIKEIPVEISLLKDLQYFSISKNKVESLPPEIGELSNLYFLNVNQNDLVALPPQLGKLEKLKKLDLWSNNIETFPEEIKDMKSLKVLDLRVILIPDAEQSRIQDLLPNTKIYFSPYCRCAQ